MILYTACNNKYFDLYFDMWITCANKFYPRMKKYVAIGDPTENQLSHAEKLGCIPIPFDIRKPRDNEPGEQYKNIFFLLRWQYMPWHLKKPILETQINCLAIKTQKFDEFENVEHLRICRRKKGKLGGLSAAVFSPAAAKAVTEKALSWNNKPPVGDHPINEWTSQNIPYVTVLAEQQFKDLEGELEPQTCWITAGTSKHFTHDQKIEILKHYTNLAGIKI